MDEYDKIQILGRGGCGSVYLVNSKKSSSVYAMKEIQLDPKRRTRTKEYVLKEVRILSGLNHPHIVSFVRSFFDDQEEALYIVQDFCDGGTLQEKIDAAIKDAILLSECKIMRWFVQILSAIDYIHANRILHRDIKAQNVFLTDKEMVKLGDFGIAMTLENTLDLAQTCVGTPCYLSPEVCRSQPYGVKSDMWALGCLLYELCALHYAFDATNIISLFNKIVKGEWEPLPLSFSDDMITLVSILLSCSINERPSAKNVLGLPYVQSHLEAFSGGSQYLIGDAEELWELQRADVSPCSNKNLSAKETGNYDDDFVAECESDYSDDFEADTDDDEEDKTCSKRPIDVASDEAVGALEVRKGYCPSKVVRCKTGGRQLDRLTSHFQKANHNYIKRACIDELGIENFEKVSEICLRHQENEFRSFQSEFVKIAGRDSLETCFLVNELVVDKRKM